MNRGKREYEIEDWSKIKYMVRYEWGVKVNCEYPNPNIEEGYFEDFQTLEEFVSEYTTGSTGINNKILLIIEISRFIKIETYEVATKVRLV